MMTRKENAEIYEKFYRDTNKFISQTERKIHEAQAKLENVENFDEYKIIEDMVDIRGIFLFENSGYYSGVVIGIKKKYRSI